MYNASRMLLDEQSHARARDDEMFRREFEAKQPTQTDAAQVLSDRLVAARRSAERHRGLSAVFGSVATLATGIAIMCGVRASHLTDEVMHRIEKDRERARADLMSTENSGIDPRVAILLRGSAEERADELGHMMGEDYVDSIFKKNSSTRSTSTLEAQHIDEPVEITGTRDRIEPAEAHEYLRGFPASWIKGKIKSIKFEAAEHGEFPSYMKASGKVAATYRPGAKLVTVYSRITQRERLHSFDATMGHEIAHANDWEHNPELSPDERIELLAKVAARLISENRFHSGYVESIETSDTQTTFVRKCKEYFAEIAGAYFNSPTTLHYKDFVIIHDLLRRTDPHFDIEYGKRTRVVAFNTDVTL